MSLFAMVGNVQLLSFFNKFVYEMCDLNTGQD